ncbi:hypothetical protein SAY87_024640 [Trapa incisa]|uniref:Uncharacterized protein n=1 Tax=Trapa incisa TaxID=236973 RepID=A0AAN7JFK0_9MYRT|nr:hypothetical protein SAY87_024640 [Trapa incisa]
MGRSPCCEKVHTNKGAWTRKGCQLLFDYIHCQGEGCWCSLPKSTGKYEENPLTFLRTLMVYPFDQLVRLKFKLHIGSNPVFPKFARLLRWGKCCRLMWVNYLRPRPDHKLLEISQKPKTSKHIIQLEKFPWQQVT